MRSAASLVLALLLVGSGCEKGNPMASEEVPLGKSFDLRVGQTVVVEGEGLLVTFNGIKEDSRCPKGVVCIWEGDTVARVTTEKGPEESFDLHTSGRFQREAAFRGYRIALVDVAPYPEVDKEIDPKEYVATLRVDPAS